MSPYQTHLAHPTHSHCPALLPSSPTLSASSSDSLPYPLTPPPLDHYRSPYACSPLPPVSGPSSKPAALPTSGPVRINPILGFSPHPALVWDLTLPCTSIMTAHRQQPPPHALSAPATAPPRSSLTIISPHLPWSIAVFPSAPGPEACVTVADVLHTLQHALHLVITDEQYRTLPSREVQRMVTAAHDRRVGPRRAVGRCEVGVRSVDCLMGRTRFTGLASTRFGPGIWALNVA